MKITKEEAIDRLKRDAEYCKANPITCGDNAYECYELAIDALEKADKSDRPKGEWIDALSGNDIVGDMCSECSFYISRELNDYNFCPRCGADMRGYLTHKNNSNSND